MKEPIIRNKFSDKAVSMACSFTTFHTTAPASTMEKAHNHMTRIKCIYFLRTIAWLTLFLPLISSADNIAFADFTLSKDDKTKIDMPLTIESDPGDNASVRWVYSFSLLTKDNDGTIGYIALQRNKGKKQVEFGIYNASAVLIKPSTDLDFLEEKGRLILYTSDWKLHNKYLLRVEKDPTNYNDNLSWWKASIIDTSNNVAVELGSIGADEDVQNISGYITGMSYALENGDNCEKIPYARARFGVPQSDDGEGTVKFFDS